MTGNRRKTTDLSDQWRRVFTLKRVILLLAAYVLVALILMAVQRTAHRLLFREFQTKTKQLAQLLASNVYARDLAKIHGPEDVETLEFKKIVGLFQDTKAIYDDVAFIYALRRNPETGQWFFIVDADPFDVDKNGDGRISPAEEGVLPGREYEEAADMPVVAEALEGPTADEDFSTDYWGTFISGYAPVIDPFSGEAVAVLGVDVTRETFEAKYSAVRVAVLLSFVVLVILLTLVFIAFYGKAFALQVAKSLEREIQEKNVALEETVTQLRERESIMNQELALAQEVQERFLPKEFPLPEDLRFAADYRACAEIGGDLYDAFRIHERTAGFFIADVVGHGVSAALITAALKASIERYRQTVFQRFHRTADLQTPIEVTALEEFMHDLNKTMNEILSSMSFLTLQMGVLLPDRQDLLLANAGHPPPVLWEKATNNARVIPLKANLPIGIQPELDLDITAIEVNLGDKFILYTDGLTERMNPKQDAYGIERFLQCVQQYGSLPPDQLIRQITEDADRFSAGVEPHDDQAVVVVELVDERVPSGSATGKQ